MTPTKKPAYDYRTLLSYRVVVLANILSKGAARLYTRRFNLQLSEWRLLAALAIDAPAGARRIAQSLGADKGWVSRTLAALARKGLVVYAEHPEDSRRIDIGLTPKGRKLHRLILPVALERQRLLFEGFSASDEHTFRRLLDELQRRAESVLDALPGTRINGAKIRTSHRKLRTDSPNSSKSVSNSRGLGAVRKGRGAQSTRIRMAAAR